MRREYERAAHYRDLLDTVRAPAPANRRWPRRISATAICSRCTATDDRAALQVFLVRDGLVVERRQYFWDEVGGADDDELLTTCVQQYYHGGTASPPEVCVPIRTGGGRGALTRWLRERAGRRGTADGASKRGAKKRLLELVGRTRQLAFAHRYEKW